jgi:pyruvate-formate lyase-activating enzyme
MPLTYIDQTVVSIKAYHDELHRDYTGVSNQEILKNFCQIYSQGKNLRAESVFIPDYVDKAEIGAIARFIAGIDRAIPYRIDAYFPAGNNPWRRAGPKEVEEAVKEARKYLLNVSSLKGDEELNYSVIRIY